MSTSTAIGQVGESLKNLLEGEMQPSATVTLLAPDDSSSGNRRINLFLYKIQENPFLRNLDWQLKSGTSDTLVPPPVSLNLFYLMTAYAQNDPHTGHTNAHEILGEAIRVFHEQALVPATYLTYDLQAAQEHIKITPTHLDLNELSQVWGTFQGPFRLSVPYEVSVVQIDSAQEQLMPARVRKTGTPQTEAPFQAPKITQMTPRQGPVGTPITFYGEHLTDWFAYVRISGQSLLDQHRLTSDSFTVTVPNELVPGFHQIQVDISHLFRATFFFEIIS